MPPSAPSVVVSPQVRLAFDEGCRDLFATSEQPPWRGRGAHDVLLRFAEHYERLSALPRRIRRAVERQWKRSLSAVALLMALGQAPASAAMIQVSPATPPSINADGKCSLIEAIVNANRNLRTHLDCVAGSGPDTIILPASSQQVLNAQQMLPAITSPIVIEGNGSTVLRNTRSRLDFFTVGASGDLTLNETTVTGTEGLSWVGYGVSNAGRLALNNSSIARTGGLFNSGGVAVLNDSSVTGTRTGPDNYPYGGIQNRAGGTLCSAPRSTACRLAMPASTSRRCVGAVHAPPCRRSRARSRSGWSARMPAPPTRRPSVPTVLVRLSNRLSCQA